MRVQADKQKRMYSSTNLAPYTLPHGIRAADIKRFLDHLLNLQADDAKAVKRFVTRFQEWLPQFRTIYTVEARRAFEGSLPPAGQEQAWEAQKQKTLERMVHGTIGNLEIWSVEPTTAERLEDGLILQQRLKDVWSLPTAFLREVGVLELLTSRLDPRGRALLLNLKTHPGPFNVFDQIAREIPARVVGAGDLQDILRLTLGRFEWALLFCMRSADRLRVCQNNECRAPYFIAQRRSQKYCSEQCAQPSQREFKRKWWADHGKAQRQKDKTEARRKPSRKRGK
jgi:hypothetical protein